jgi:hypothetical protein
MSDTVISLEGKQASTVILGAGAANPLKLDTNGNLVVTQGHAKYREMVAAGRVNIVSVAVTGVAMGTALSTTPPLALHNPVGSRVNLSILKTTVAYLSGTLSYGIINYGTVIQATAPSSGAALVPKNALVGESRGKAQAYTGSTQTAATVIYTPYSFGVQAATTALGITTCQDVVDGLIEVPPGYVFVMESTSAGAGTTPLCVMGIAWEEIAIS